MSFIDGFESGDFSAWDGYRLDALVTSPGRAASNYKMTSKADLEYAWKSVVGKNFRVYVQMSSLPANGEFQDFIRVKGALEEQCARIGIYNDAGTYKWYLNVWENQVQSVATVSANQWVCLEMEYNVDTDVHHLYVDGSLAITVNQDATVSITKLLTGFCYGTFVSTTNFDDVAAANKYIGLLAAYLRVVHRRL